jgi:molybdate transport system substrate-binding protein
VRRRGFLAALGAVSAGARLSADGPGEILVLAAASLTEALSEIGAGYTTARGQVVVFAFGGSGQLARQILAGAPAAVFVSADAASVDELQRGGRVAPADRCDLLSNRLVVVVPSSSSLRVGAAADLDAVRRLALADPEAVPAGRYARQWLERAGAWTLLRDRVVPTLDVRAALAAVEAGAVDAAVVYATDARRSTRARVALEVPPEQAPRIAYVAAVLAPAGRRFFEHLRSIEARAVFERLGFVVTASLPGRAAAAVAAPQAG